MVFNAEKSFFYPRNSALPHFLRASALKIAFAAVTLLTSVSAQTCGGQGNLAGQPATTPAWMNPSDPTWTAAFPYTPANRAAALVNAMTLAQMEQQMAGVGGNFTLGDITGCGNAARHLLGI